MSELLELRCSALPLAFKCPGSVRKGAVAINDTSDAAELGTAAHEGLAILVNTGRVDWDGVPALAKGHGFNEGELRGLLASGAKLWAQVKESFPHPMTEAELDYEGPGFHLTGHADILGRDEDTAISGDWKGGRLDSDYREQVLGYAALSLLDYYRHLQAARASVLWVREGDVEQYSLKRSDLPAWEERLVREVVEWDGTYRPGPHCAHCRRNHECAAANALVRRDVAAIADLDLVARVEDEDALALMSPDQMVDILSKADIVSKYADRVRSAIRAHVIRNGDVVGCGKRLTLQHEERRSLNVIQAMTVLEDLGFRNRLDLAPVIDISAAKVEKVIAERAGKGNGAGAVREFRAALEAAEAVETVTVTKLVTRRA